MDVLLENLIKESRSREIEQLKTEGYSNREIAARMGVDEKTIFWVSGNNLRCKNELLKVPNKEAAMASSNADHDGIHIWLG